MPHEALPASAPFSSSTSHSDALPSLNSQRSPLAPSKTPSLSSRSSSGSSNDEASAAPPTQLVDSPAYRRPVNQSTARTNAKHTPLTALRRQRSAKTAASSASPVSVKMLNDDFPLPPVNVSADTSTGSKTNRILGPDGQLYTQGEAAKLGLIIRTACEACRNRKLKCSGTLPKQGGCGRCSSDGIQCVYSARAPIGRPKKRKVEDTPDPTIHSTSMSPVVSGRGKAKRTRSTSNSLGHIATRIKTEQVTPLNSPRTNQDVFSLNSSPAFQRVHVSTYPSAGTSTQSEAVQQCTTPHDLSPAGPVAPPPFNLYGSPMKPPQAPDSNSNSSRLVSTPTIWSQNPAAFAMTPSDATTPHSVTSYTDARQSSSQSLPPTSTSASAAKLPSLDDLSVAAFLQSLDTLEISPTELFQQQQQQSQHHVHGFSGATSGSGTPSAVDTYGLGTPFDDRGTNTLAAADPASMQEWATSSAILQPGLSFAVPADFSWWDLGLNGADFGAASSAASVSATPSTELGSMMFPSTGTVQSRMPVASGSQGQNTTTTTTTTTSSSSSTAVEGASVTIHPPSSTNHSQPAKPRRSTVSADQLWPRGADAGMGQGQIQHTVAASETGLGWSTLPHPSHLAEALSSPVESRAGKTAEHGSCCSSKSANTASLSPAENNDEQHGEEVKASCCSSKAKADTANSEPAMPASCCVEKNSSESPAVALKTASCCADKGEAVLTSPAAKEETKSCCSGHDAGPSSSMAADSEASEEPIEMGPLSTSAAAVHGNSVPRLDNERKRHAAVHTHHPGKVHCVPNPSGKGCTCLCDMSVALLSVKQVLRETDPHKAGSASSAKSFATDTIQLTLTASQAITAQCACSADCPTCQSDPSTEISASLLVSTALQIYARAVRILREGFSSGEGASVQSFFGGLDVTIGSYKPSANNAKKIALYAIKLELKDLRKALGKISRMAQSFGIARKEVEGESGKHGMNPIDQLVILKLYRQLTELLKTIEGLEDAA